MDKQQLLNRIAKLRAEYAELMANAAATSGAIQDCEYWLAMIEQEEKEKAKPDAIQL